MPAANVITVRELGTGTHGWANECFWYVFGKTYARRHGLSFELDRWAGDGLVVGEPSPPLVHRDLPSIQEHVDHGVSDTLVPHAPEPLRGINFLGYFQYHTGYYAPDRDYIRALLRPLPEIEAGLSPAWESVRARGRTVVTVHLRRADYGFAYFARIPVRWYLRFLDTLWPTLDRPVLYVATDAPELIPAFERFRPLSAEALGPALPGRGFYRDFYALSKSDVTIIPNSTFSFLASMLNPDLTAAYRSHLPARSFLPFDPWNDLPLHRGREEQVETYPLQFELWKPRHYVRHYVPEPVRAFGMKLLRSLPARRSLPTASAG